MFIGAKTVDCSGEGKNKCMMVKNSPEKNWEFFYDQIEGFKHEQGFEYQLLIEIVDLPEESKDGAFVKYVLKRVISKTVILHLFCISDSISILITITIVCKSNRAFHFQESLLYSINIEATQSVNIVLLSEISRSIKIFKIFISKELERFRTNLFGNF